jgi:hypothetical protein
MSENAFRSSNLLGGGRIVRQALTQKHSAERKLREELAAALSALSTARGELTATQERADREGKRPPSPAAVSSPAAVTDGGMSAAEVEVAALRVALEESQRLHARLKVRAESDRALAASRAEELVASRAAVEREQELLAEGERQRQALEHEQAQHALTQDLVRAQQAIARRLETGAGQSAKEAEDAQRGAAALEVANEALQAELAASREQQQAAAAALAAQEAAAAAAAAAASEATAAAEKAAVAAEGEGAELAARLLTSQAEGRAELAEQAAQQHSALSAWEERLTRAEAAAARARAEARVAEAARAQAEADAGRSGSEAEAARATAEAHRLVSDQVPTRKYTRSPAAGGALLAVVVL